MRNFGYTVIKNAMSNLVRGGATAAVALALPHFLTKALDLERFSAWSLVLQIAAYAGYLDFGIQMAVARFLAQAIELEQKERQQQLVNTALLLLSMAGIVAMIVIGSVILLAPHFFHGLPPALLSEVSKASLVLTVCASLLLPLSTFTGILVGLHRNEFPAIAIGGSRLAGATAAIVASHYTNSLLVLALCIGVCNLMGGVVQWIAARQLLPQIKSSLMGAQRAMAIELARYCGGLTVWAFGAFLISGLDVTIIAHYNFEGVGYYALASSLIMFVVGLNQMIFNAIMTPIAALQARGEIDRIRRIVISTTRLNTYLNLVIIVLVCEFGLSGLDLWVGRSYALLAFPVLVVLTIGQAIRLMRTSYGVMLIGTGQQNHAIPQGVAEAVVNFGLSIPGAIFMGPIGVAWGTVIGAIAGSAWQQFHTISRANAVPFRPMTYLMEGMVRPLLCCAPMLAGVAYRLIKPTLPYGLEWLIALTVVTVILLAAQGKLKESISLRA
jgi:O-antigen/teichoic acid export membrane protein